MQLISHNKTLAALILGQIWQLAPPSADILVRLRSRGFKWSKSMSQSQRTNQTPMHFTSLATQNGVGTAMDLGPHVSRDEDGVFGGY